MKQVLVSWHHLLICSSTGMENCDPSAHDCSSLGIAIFSCMFTESPKKTSSFALLDWMRHEYFSYLRSTSTSSLRENSCFGGRIPCLDLHKTAVGVKKTSHIKKIELIWRFQPLRTPIPFPPKLRVINGLIPPAHRFIHGSLGTHYLQLVGAQFAPQLGKPDAASNGVIGSELVK